ncbi:MAG: MarR family transcriptional regulator [Fulvimarina manganoxydans]|uniref:MarR family winged helix-turn-helix transcriptional regulator n=1 Tax=Fulvimarina manganoxydans TaxID=937218 RepID=UPI002356D132|nr:MarR family transcriptional regulator [Fulvimarina manganoxydans]MCK5933331.1 MarR family transcriptional regulator [Fulvimarina manganoxydans]
MLEASFVRRFGAEKLSFLQIRIIGHLYIYEGCSQRDLGKALNLDAMVVSRQVDRLVELDLVERRMSETDRRSRRLYLTKRAVALRDELYQKSMDVMAQALKGASDEDIQCFKRVLLGFVDNLEKDQFDYEMENDPR